MLRAMAQQLLTLSARRIIAVAPEPPRPYAKRMAGFDALITDHLCERWRVSDYAAALGMTPTHLNRVTRAETGESAARYVERHLLQEARRMLAYTREPVGAISWHLGFEDAALFFAQLSTTDRGNAAGLSRAVPSADRDDIDLVTILQSAF